MIHSLAYLIEYGRLCDLYSKGLLGWGDFKYAIENLNDGFDSNARVL